MPIEFDVGAFCPALWGILPHSVVSATAQMSYGTGAFCPACGFLPRSQFDNKSAGSLYPIRDISPIRVYQA